MEKGIREDKLANSEKVFDIVRSIIETFKLDISGDEIAGFDFKWRKETTDFSLKTFPVKPTPIEVSHNGSQFLEKVSYIETGFLNKDP